MPVLRPTVWCVHTVYSECEVSPCENGGSCIAHAGSLNCLCSSDYTGAYCEDKGQQYKKSV